MFFLFLMGVGRQVSLKNKTTTKREWGGGGGGGGLVEKQNKKEAKDQTEKAFVMKCRRGTRSKLRLDADVGQRRPARLSRRHSETDIVSRRSCADT